MKSLSIKLKETYSFLGDNGADPTLDCYIPSDWALDELHGTKRPCMVICPGGGYECMSEHEAEPVTVHFLAMGFNVFVLRYSVSPHRFPTQLREVAAAMEIICSNADIWHCDVSKIGIMGFSAGGHLAAHYSNAYDFEEVRSVFPESKRPFCTVLGYPVITADPKHCHMGSFVSLVGHEPDADEQLKFSCDKLVGEDSPPAFVWSTAQDTVVPIMNSFLYCDALNKNHIPYELHVYPYGWHGLSTCDSSIFFDDLVPEMKYTEQWVDCLKKWIRLTF